jgi:uncharacterized low-complexity protein
LCCGSYRLPVTTRTIIKAGLLARNQTENLEVLYMAHKTLITRPIAAAVGVAFVSSLAASTAVAAADDPFELAELDSGYLLAGEHGGEEGKCGEKGEEGKCGEKGEEGKCGEKGEEGKCGEKGEEGKCGEGKCGGDEGDEGDGD